MAYLRSKHYLLPQELTDLIKEKGELAQIGQTALDHILAVKEDVITGSSVVLPDATSSSSSDVGDPASTEGDGSVFDPTIELRRLAVTLADDEKTKELSNEALELLYACDKLGKDIRNMSYKIELTTMKQLVPVLYKYSTSLYFAFFFYSRWAVVVNCFVDLVTTLQGKFRQPPEGLEVPVAPFYRMLEVFVHCQSFKIDELLPPVINIRDGITNTIQKFIPAARFLFPTSAFEYMWVRTRGYLSPAQLNSTMSRFAVFVQVLPTRFDPDEKMLAEVLDFIAVARHWFDYTYLFQYYASVLLSAMSSNLMGRAPWSNPGPIAPAPTPEVAVMLPAAASPLPHHQLPPSPADLSGSGTEGSAASSPLPPFLPSPRINDLFTIIHQSFRIPIGSKEEARATKSLEVDNHLKRLGSVDQSKLHRNLAKAVVWSLPPDPTTSSLSWERLKYLIRCVDPHLRPGVRLTVGSESVCNFVKELSLAFQSRLRAQADTEHCKVPQSWHLDTIERRAFVKLLMPIMDMIFLNSRKVPKSAMGSLAAFSGISATTLMEPLQRRVIMGLTTSTEPHQIMAVLELLSETMYKMSLDEKVHSALVETLRLAAPLLIESIDINDAGKTGMALGTVCLIHCSYGIPSCIFTMGEEEWVSSILNAVFKYTEACTSETANFQFIVFLGSILPLFAVCSEPTLEMATKTVLEHILSRQNPKMILSFRGVIEPLIMIFPKSVDTLLPALASRCLSTTTDAELSWYGSLFYCLLSARGDVLIPWLSRIEEVADKLLEIDENTTKTRTKVGAKIIRNTLQGLLNVIPAEFSPWNPGDAPSPPDAAPATNGDDAATTPHLPISMYDVKSAKVAWWIPPAECLVEADRIFTKYCRVTMNRLKDPVTVATVALAAVPNGSPATTTPEGGASTSSTPPPPRATNGEKREGDVSPPPQQENEGGHTTAAAANNNNNNNDEADPITPALVVRHSLQVLRYVMSGGRALLVQYSVADPTAYYHQRWSCLPYVFLWPDVDKIDATSPKDEPRVTLDELFQAVFIETPELSEELLEVKSLKLLRKIAECFFQGKGGIGSLRSALAQSMESGFSQSQLKNEFRRCPRLHWILSGYSSYIRRQQLVYVEPTEYHVTKLIDLGRKLSVHRFSKVRIAGQHMFGTYTSWVPVAKRRPILTPLLSEISKIADSGTEDYHVTGILHLMRLPCVLSAALWEEDLFNQAIIDLLKADRLARDTNESRKVDLVNQWTRTLGETPQSANSKRRLTSQIFSECIDLNAERTQYNPILAARALFVLCSIVTMLDVDVIFPHQDFLSLVLRMCGDTHVAVHDTAMSLIFSLFGALRENPVAVCRSSPTGLSTEDITGKDVEMGTDLTMLGHLFPFTDAKFHTTDSGGNTLFRTIAPKSSEGVMKLKNELTASLFTTSPSWMDENVATLCKSQRKVNSVSENRATLWILLASAVDRKRVSTKYFSMAKKLVRSVLEQESNEERTSEFAVAAELLAAAIASLSEVPQEDLEFQSTFSTTPVDQDTSPTESPTTASEPPLASLKDVIDLFVGLTKYIAVKGAGEQFTVWKSSCFLSKMLYRVSIPFARRMFGGCVAALREVKEEQTSTKPLTCCLKMIISLLHAMPLHLNRACADIVKGFVDDQLPHLLSHPLTQVRSYASAFASGITLGMAETAAIPLLCKGGLEAANDDPCFAVSTDVMMQMGKSISSLLSKVPSTLALSGEGPLADEAKTVAKGSITYICAPRRTCPGLHHPQYCRMIVTSILFSADIQLPKDMDDNVGFAVRSLGFSSLPASSVVTCLETCCEALGPQSQLAQTRKGKMVALSLIRIFLYYNAVQLATIKHNHFAPMVVEAALVAMGHVDRRVRDEGEVLFAVTVRLLRGEQLTLLVRRFMAAVGTPQPLQKAFHADPNEDECGSSTSTPTLPTTTTTTVRGAVGSAPTPSPQDVGLSPPVSPTPGERKRLAAVCALCAALNAFPDSVPSFAPVVMTKLAGFVTDGSPDVVSAVRTTLTSWWKAHRDLWEFEHQQKFTEQQLEVLMELFRSPSYYV